MYISPKIPSELHGNGSSSMNANTKTNSITRVIVTTHFCFNPECELSLSKTSGQEDEVASFLLIAARACGGGGHKCLQGP